MNTFEKNMERINAAAAARQLGLNPDRARLDKVVGLMAQNYDLTGEWICPCKQQQRPPVPGRDVCCPCPELEEEISETGYCRCRVFFRQPNVSTDC